MAPKVEPISGPLELGEGPYWDEESQTLYFVDIFNHTVHSYNPKTNKHNFVKVETEGKPVSLIIKIKGEKNKFVISIKNDLAVVIWDGISSKPLTPEYLVNVESKDNPTRLNDGKCDPSNRLWTGTMGGDKKGDSYSEDKGSLYFIQKDKTVKKHLTKIGISNGLAWSPDKKKFYYIDSLKYRIDSYDYDDASGAISNEKTVFCFKKNNIEKFPDGMTIDQEGMLWVACFLGAQVLRVNPNTGELMQKVEIPSAQITSAVFGGPNFEDLYVTSASLSLSKELQEKYPLAGHTFKVTGLGVKGTPSLPIEI